LPSTELLLVYPQKKQGKPLDFKQISLVIKNARKD